MKKYTEEIEESKLLVEEENIKMISDLLNKHIFLYVEFPLEVEIAVQSKSILTIMKMANLYIEESVLFAYRVPDNLSNGRSSIQKINAKQLSHHSRNPSGALLKNDIIVPILPNKESIHEP